MRIWNLLNRRRRERELDEEIRAHLAMAVRDRIERGEDPREAELAARREFGNRTLVEEATREVWGWRVLEDMLRDVRYAVRGMRRSPGVTAAAVLSLALGIGANTAIFSLMYTVMLRSLPVARPEELVELLQKYPGEPRGNGYWSQRSYEHYRDHNHVFSELTGTSIDNVVRVKVEGSERQILKGEYVMGNYFSLLGVRLALGRMLGPEDKPGTGVVVVSWALWNSRFQQDPGVIGRRLLVDDESAEIVGVAPRQFTGLRVNAQTDVWMPSKPKAGLALFGRLKPGVSLEQAQAEIATLYRFTIEERAEGSKDPLVRQLRVELELAAAGFSGVRDRVGQPLAVLMAIVAVLLLLACVNVAGLLLARGAGRAREMALRLGLGASRGRLLRQMLTESMLLSLLGTLAGAVVAIVGTSALVRIMDSGREHEQLHLQVRPDGTLLLFGAALAVLTGMLFGLAPALSALRSTPASPLRQSGKSVETRWQRFLGQGLVSTQVALSMLLLSAGGLFLGHVWNLRGTDLGFRRDHVLLVQLDPSQSGLIGERLAAVYRELLERLGALPDVRSVSLSAPTPLQGAGASGFAIVEGFTERAEDRRRVSISYVGPRYFATMETRLLAGREFEYRDASMNPRPAIINRTMARRYFAGRDPIGKRITLENVTLSRTPSTYEIVGVAEDANYMEIREEQRRSIYLPAFRGTGVTAGTLVIRTQGSPERFGGEVRRLVAETGETIAVTRMITLSDQVDASIVLERMMGTLAGFFAALGALLAGIGVYGLLAYAVTRRTGEIGIRLALGATPSRVLRMVLRESLGIVTVGVVLGIPLALWGRRAAAALVADLSVHPARSLAIGVAGIIVVALAASYVPARRAASVNPMESLRHE